MPVDVESYSMTEQDLQLGLTNANEQLERIVSEKIEKAKTLHAAIAETQKKVLDYKLYIPENVVAEGIDIEQIQEVYPGKLKIVSQEEYSKVISAKAEKTAYLMITLKPSGGKMRYYHTIVDASSNETLALFSGKGAKYYTPGYIQPAITKKSLKTYEKEFVK